MSKDTQDNVGMSYLDSNATKVFKTYLPLLLFLFVLLFPFYWMGITAFKPDNELLSRDGNPFWIVAPTLGSRRKATV
ncbi:MAG: Inner rane transporter permease protein YcjP [Pseudomonadota bacterium]